jgi:hypothetical protein
VTATFAQRIVVLHRALAAAELRHGFGGAVALAYHVLEPRTTRDIDINVSVATDAAASVLEVLPEGIDVEAGAAEVIHRDGQIRLWWDGREGVPVDLFFPQHEFHEHVARAITFVPFLDTEIPIISATHLVIFKTLFNRPRDWPDIEAMLDAGSVDTSDAVAWVERLLGANAEPLARLTRLAEQRTAGPWRGTEAARVDWEALGR